MNNVSLIGRLVKDSSITYSQSGTAVLKNSLAVNRKFKKDETDFINILAFGKTAELIANHLNKGDQVGIEGHIQTGSYEKEGKKIYTFEVVVDNITFIGSKKDVQQQNNQSHTNTSSNDKNSSQGNTGVGDDPFKSNGQIDIDDSDLPF
jgi:single-strand DNA-binding protein